MPQINEFKPKQKRQRLTFTCNYCKKRKIKCDKAKPSCANCVRLGRVCQYESPYWVNTRVENDAVKMDVLSKNDNYANKSKQELYKEIEFWKAKATSANTSNTLSSGSSPKTPTSSTSCSTELGSHANDIIDLYSAYDSLCLKRSSDEDVKPLSPMSIYRADHYMSFFLCFRFITLQVASKSLTDKIKEGWKSKHPDGATKWLSLLDTKDADSELQTAIERVTNDRSQLFKANTLPFISFQDSDDTYVKYLTTSIEEVLPNRLIFDLLLNTFFEYIWPLSPYVEEDSFRDDLKRLVKFDGVGANPKVILSERSDFAILSTLLIILRYTSIAVQSVDYKDLRLSLTPLKKSIVPVQAISVAQMCLSMYKVLKKTSLSIIQALLYLRIYFKNCPEDGDGLTLGQSLMLFGFIAQSALTIGLHRDPSNFSVLKELKTANLRRNIWYGIVSLDTDTTVLSGTLSCIPNSNLTAVKLPKITIGDPVERAQLVELEKERGLQSIYRELCGAINEMNEAPNLKQFIGLLKSSRDYINLNYSMSFLSVISNHDQSSQIYKAAILKNHKILEKNLLQVCLEITIYQSLFVKYEQNKSLSDEMFKLFFKKCLESTTMGFDISDAYLSGSLSNYLNPMQSNFQLFPITTTLTYRMINAVTAILLRIFHAQELLICELFSTQDAKVIPQDFEKFIKPLCQICENHLNIFEKTIGAKYHLSLKVICSCKFSYSALKKHRFSVLNKIVSFLETNDEGQVKDIFWKGVKREDIRTSFETNTSLFAIYSQWMQMSKSYKAANVEKNGVQLHSHQKTQEPYKYCDSIINIDHPNHVVWYSNMDIDQLVEITSGSKYCSVSANSHNVEETFINGLSSASNNFESFYEILSQDAMFNAQMSNVLQKSQSNLSTLNADSGINTDGNMEMNLIDDNFINELFGPTVGTAGDFGLGL